MKLQIETPEGAFIPSHFEHERDMREFIRLTKLGYRYHFVEHSGFEFFTDPFASQPYRLDDVRIDEPALKALPH